MERYEELEIEVIVFEKEDVIVCSGKDYTETPEDEVTGGNG